MILRFGDKIFEKIDAEKSVVNISKSTNKEIEKITINIKLIGDESKDKFLGILDNRDKDNICSIDKEGKILKRYKVSNKSWSYTGNFMDENTSFNFSIELEEIEELKIESLIISGIEFDPYEYLEDFDDESLIITAKVKISTNSINELIIDKYNKKEIYFPVIRKGINEIKKLMRFGQIFWSKNDDIYKFDLILVEKSYDENAKGLKDNHIDKIYNIQELLAYTSNYLDGVIELLINKKLLNTKEIESIKDKANGKVKEKIRDFYKVKDI